MASPVAWPGSISPARVAIVKPSSGEKPIEVSSAFPSLTDMAAAPTRMMNVAVAVSDPSLLPLPQRAALIPTFSQREKGQW